WSAEVGRHRAYGALAGGLLRDGLPAAMVETLVQALAEGTGDEEVAKRVARVAESARALKEGTPVTGWPCLAKALGDSGPRVVRRVGVLLGLVITVEQLAANKALPVEFLAELGLHDLDTGGVGIDYRDAASKVVATKRRTRLAAKEGSYWPKGTSLAAYGV